MDANGYIYFSQKTTKNGWVFSCNGAMNGQSLDFRFSKCDAPLRKKLTEKDVTGVAKDSCDDVPERAIRVEFNIGASGTEAVDLTEF